ncbi:EscC/YscC/HrcC family type III secretion system outer membrane ring protein [Burkholderia stabilis]|uniref:type III secretion system outer membrane ring subunit SctC n=1 Tax=Burkholderia stabilis TaxID=95485 RepID=UPI000851924A|nr:type III secretion system outer membrane ring subunit SctC [Burkholderia stabilis]AOR72415.1 EscC/YscC/HrcC family type III secretion system outer membrane ring protein [Burkholderia stabilis]HDR9489685.1 type III secretion system outer membrane ring subunit SctC [Burkholderia stabilis]HDR9536502.1 type III secretion system outer membrane ring subunit SctC [Burkholderia stabilis]HDR9552015.1 type III secretion system outer membrane ring subunit SctC [Burkholderia stabilis]HDR9562977.1 type 
MRPTMMFCAAWAAGVIGLTASGVAHADAVRWRNGVAHVTAEGKDLKDVLRDLLASQGVTASIADNVQGTVTGRFDMPPQRILDALAATFGFVWFYDGSVMSISNANDVTRQIVRLDNASIGDLNSTLRSMGLDDKRFPITYDNGARTLIVSGPPQYVQMVSAVAKHLDETLQRANGTVVRAFKLRSAWAADHKVQIDGKPIVVPGVATVVSNLYHPKQSGTAGTGSKAAIGGVQRLSGVSDVNGDTDGGSPLRPPLPPGMERSDASRSLVGGLLGSGPAPSSGKNGALIDAQSGRSGSTTMDTGRGDESLPVVEADPTTNSVLIRDTPQRIGLYAPLIEKLDARPNLIEIEAHIIEINDDLLRQIGVDWRAHNSHVDIQTGSGTLQQNGYNGNINPNFGVTTLSDGTTAVATTPVGGAITAVLGNAGRYLLARITALESTSEARIDASPKVATLDNVEAVMDNKTRFFVRVQGYTAGDLYAVSTGVSLRVLPMVVQDDGVTRIKLDVHIEDGQITGDKVDTLPVITSSEINTQAFVGDGESLLIAGYSTDNDSNGVARVPWLSKIPLVGALFRDTNRSHKHMERVFLLTPRILHF